MGHQAGSRAGKEAGRQSHEEDECTSICVHHALHFKCDIPGLEQVLARPEQIENPEVFQVPAAFVRGDGPLTKGKPTLWRGISVDLFDSSDYDVGKTVTWWSITSTTGDINVAKNFTKGCGGKCTLFTIESQTSTDIAQMPFFGNEKESLMAPGTQLEVLSKRRNGNVAEIHLKEVNRLVA